MMKAKIFKILLISILSILSMYSNANCGWVATFKENYLYYFQKDDIFFIKGVALDVFEYGRTIEVIEDLKGNFTGESSIFVWGGGNSPKDSGCIPTNERMDHIELYQENDTLIMLVKSVTFECLEAISDYTTITCGYSVLKLSNGFVTGEILPLEERDADWWNWWNWYESMPKEEKILYFQSLPEEERFMLGMHTMPWRELQTLLNTTAIQSVQVKNNIYQQNGTIFFENQENKSVKLLFYDLSGRLLHEAITTSNSYRPVLTGNIFVCKININNDSQTIKYIVP